MGRGELLTEIMESKGFNVMSLSKASGVPYTTIRSMIERDLTNASIDNVIKICRVLGISVESLAKPKNDVFKEESAKYITQPSVDLPLYGSIAAGALSKIEAVTDQDVEYLKFPRHIFGKYSDHNDLFVLRVNGESMNKIIPNGSYVVCKPIDKYELKDDDIVIFSYDGDYSMKRFRRDTENGLLIFSPESFDRRFYDIVIPHNAPNDLKIYAKVIFYAVALD